MYHPIYHIHTHSNKHYTESSSPYHHQPACKNPHQFQQYVRESIALNHRLRLIVLFSCSCQTFWVWRFPLTPTASGNGSRVCFCVSLPPSSPRFDGISSKHLGEVTVESDGNFEDCVWFLSCQLFGPVNHAELERLDWGPSLDYHCQWYFQKPV